MARKNPKGPSANRRYRVYDRSLSYRFVDVYARSAAEARESTDCLDDESYHYVDDDWELDYVRELEDDEQFFPVNDLVESK